MPIRYALLREGTTDTALQIIVERFAHNKGIELLFNEALSKPFNGPLGEQKVRIRTRANFDSSAVDLAFYFTDKDKGEFNKAEKIANAIKSVNESYLLKSVIGVPSPHMEAWLLAGQDCVKHLFSWPGDEPLPLTT
jgi:hypothetical protein